MSRFALFVLYISALLLCFAIPQVTSYKFKCNAEEKNDIDNVVARIMTYGRKDSKFPTNNIELKQFCKLQLELLTKVIAYKDQCLKSRPKQIVSILIFSIKAQNKVYCKNPNSKQTKALVASAVCANTATYGYLKCNDNFVDHLLAVENSKDSKQILGQLCCAYNDVYKCIRVTASKHSKVCTEKDIESNQIFIRGFFDNALNVLCAEYNDSSDRCDHFSMVKLKNSNKPKPASFFSPIVKVVSSL